MNQNKQPEKSSVESLQSRNVQSYLFLAILVVLFIFVLRLLSPFFTVVLWSMLSYIIIGPLHHRCIRGKDLHSLKGRMYKNMLAALFSFGTVVLILVPLYLVASNFAREIVDLIREIRNYITSNDNFFDELTNRFSNLIRDLSSGMVHISSEEIQRRVLQLLSSGLEWVLGYTSDIARNIWSFVVGILLMMFCLFFFYTDGNYLAKLVEHAIPIRREYMKALVNKFKETTRNLFLGYIMVSMIQALLAYLIFSLFGVEGALVFAFLVLFCTFIPMFGASLVWLPLSIVRIVTVGVVPGLLFLAVSSAAISLSDNFLRPLFLQDRIHLHPLIIFFSILGGVMLFGFNGLVLGPMIVILFLTVLDMFLTEHHINLD